MVEEIVTFDEGTEEIATFGESDEEIAVFDEVTYIGGTNDYEKLRNLPQINDVTLIGNKKSKELKLQDEMHKLTNTDILNILNL